MDAALFLEIIEKTAETTFYTGIPDSQLKALCDTLARQYGISRSHLTSGHTKTGSKHVVAANEGAAVGLAAGHFLATGTPALVYMQNSGIGNAVNPIRSLLHQKVFAIPALFVIGWRGEPGRHDEPQHVFQGDITEKLLDCLELSYYIISPETSVQELSDLMPAVSEKLKSGASFAFLVKKGGLQSAESFIYENSMSLSREQTIQVVIEKSAENDLFIATTGKLFRELYEIREQRREEHSHDFLTVGSMGHCSMIALGIAQEKQNQRVFCLDGDGSLLMHMGNMAVIGTQKPRNFIHIVINNGAHESVGKIPTACGQILLPDIAAACGYQKTFCIESAEALSEVLGETDGSNSAVFIEVKTSLLSRSDIGRPDAPPVENKKAFMKAITEEQL